MDIFGLFSGSKKKVSRSNRENETEQLPQQQSSEPNSGFVFVAQDYNPSYYGSGPTILTNENIRGMGSAASVQENGNQSMYPSLDVNRAEPAESLNGSLTNNDSSSISFSTTTATTTSITTRRHTSPLDNIPFSFQKGLSKSLSVNQYNPWKAYSCVQKRILSQNEFRLSTNMFGLVHDALEDFVIRLFGRDQWNDILTKSNLDLHGASFQMYRNYDDRITWKLIATTSRILKLDIETVLEALGNHFIKYVSEQGYNKMLKNLGSNLHDFLASIDFLHEHLQNVFVGSDFPSFRVSHSTEGSMTLFYHSHRRGLGPFVRGMVTTASSNFFKTEVIVNQVSDTNDGHIVFEVVNKSIEINSAAFERVKTPFTDSSISTSPGSLFFSVETLCETFPFHFIFKRNFQIIEMGNALKRYVVLDNSLTNKQNRIMFSDMFIIIQPIIELSFESILTFANHLFILKAREEYVRNRGKDGGKERTNSSRSEPKLRGFTLSPDQSEMTKVSLMLKGQMISLPAYDAILFMGSPKVEDLEEMMSLDLTMSDFPLHDATGRHIMSRAMRTDDSEVINKIDRAANHLRIVEKKLGLEISKNHRILNEIFPPKIARILVQNIKVDAEHFESVSCLYSDIVNFTKMCSSPKMKPIDIIRLLNKLYIQFDNQTNYYGTFKVETVGDAYIVISGCPEPVEDHADRVVEMGLAMVHVTRTIFSPVDGRHIEMRIGVHSGPCMAGIVGLSMPRYTVFGHTISVANKMEYAGPEGMVHISEATKKCLKKDKYYFVESSVKHMFGFPTYIVTKLYEEYHEDHLVVENNLNMSGGLFKSPNTTPKHEVKTKARKTNQKKQSRGIGNGGGRAGKGIGSVGQPMMFDGIGAGDGTGNQPAAKKAVPPAPSNAPYNRRDIAVPIIEIETFE